MRSYLILGVFVPLAFAFDDLGTDACAGAAFCDPEPDITATAAATPDLPTFAACLKRAKDFSSACSCFYPATGVASSGAAAAGQLGSTDAGSHSSGASAIISVTSTTQIMISTVASSNVAASTTITNSIVTPSAAAKVTNSPVTATTVAVGTAPASCTASEYAQITSVIATCTNLVLQDIAVPVSSVIDLTGLQDGSFVTFAGTTTFGTTADSDFNPLKIAGTNITITGAAGAIIDGNGQAYWDGKGSNGGTNKPDHFIVLNKMVNAVIQNLYIQNWPAHCFDVIGCEGLTITGLTLNNSAGDAPNSASGVLAAAHNSDGFDFRSSNNVVLSNTIVMNQDDCVAISSGTNITVTTMTCSGGHGLSIGSVGGKSNNIVSNVVFSDSNITDSQNGCRIKSNADTNGTIENITYRNIKMSGISIYGIDIQQDYLNGGATGDPTNGVNISGIAFDTVTGSTTSDAVNYYILCGSESCSDFTFTGVSISGGGVASTCNFPATGCPS